MVALCWRDYNFFDGLVGGNSGWNFDEVFENSRQQSSFTKFYRFLRVQTAFKGKLMMLNAM
jgi:hypothetical protein